VGGDDAATRLTLADLTRAVRLDWRDVDALMTHMVRIQELAEDGKITMRQLKGLSYSMGRIVNARAHAIGERLAELETLVERLEAHVAITHAPRPGRPRLLS
jgi:hypothetical protein